MSELDDKWMCQPQEDLEVGMILAHSDREKLFIYLIMGEF